MRDPDDPRYPTFADLEPEGDPGDDAADPFGDVDGFMDDPAAPLQEIEGEDFDGYDGYGGHAAEGWEGVVEDDAYAGAAAEAYDEYDETADEAADATSPRRARRAPAPRRRTGSDPRAAALRENQALLRRLAQRLQRAGRAAEVAGLAGAMVPLALQTRPAVYGALAPLTPQLAALVAARTLQRRRRGPLDAAALQAWLEQLVRHLAAHARRGDPLDPARLRALVARTEAAPTARRTRARTA